MAKFTGHSITSDSALGDAKIQRSLRFNDDDSAHLNRTPSSASNRRTWTWSGWVKRGELSETQGRLFGGGITGSDYLSIYLTSGDNLRVLWYESGETMTTTTEKFRDPTSWYNFVVAIDTTQSTAGDRIKMYANGNLLERDSTNLGQNIETSVNNTVEHNIGKWLAGDASYYDGYIAEVNFVDGQAYDPSYFGFTDPVTNIWMPKRYEGTYGTNGFYLDFSDNSSTATLGIDKSPNGNDFTANNFSVAAWPDNDSVIDTPTNNFITLNENDKNSNVPLINGALQTNATATGGHYPVFTTKAIKSGKWYLEWKFLTNDSGLPSIMEAQHDSGSHNTDSTVGNNTSTVNKRGYGLLPGDGRTSHNGTLASYGSAISSSDTAQCAFDADTGKIYWGKNNTWFNSGNPETGANPAFSGIDMTKEWLFTWHVYGNNNNVSVNFGSQGFTYTPPSGFKALCTENLSLNQTPSAIRPKKHFDVLLWDGNASAGHNITGLEFKPDFVWIKKRSGGSARSHQIFDVVRGVHETLHTDGSGAEDENTNRLSAFNQGGFTVNNDDGCNGSGSTNVAWCWKAGGSSNTYNIDGTGYATAAAAGLDGGTIDPTGASINTEAGFSIVTYSANGIAGATVAHGLGKKPAWIIIRCRSASDNWMVYHQQSNEGNSPEDYWLTLNSTSSTTDNPNMLNDTAPTDTLVTINNDGAVNSGSRTYVMYCWAEIPGFSKFGEYRARDTNYTGPYIHTGFKPAWVMSKGLSLSWQDWSIFDNKRSTSSTSGSNPISGKLGANQNNAEVNDNYNVVDFLSDGWRVSGLSASDINYGSSYPKQLYMAFAEESSVTPFNTFPNAQ